MATIEQVAKRAGVSVATVSRFLNKSGYVSEEASLRIQKAIEELNFQRRYSAHILAARKVFKVGIILSERINALVNEDIGSFYNIILMALEDCEKTFHFQYKRLILGKSIEEEFDGFIVVGSDATEEELQKIKKHCKVVLLDHYIDGAGIDSILSDGYDGFFQVVQRFVKKDKKRIIHIHGPLKHYGFKDRYNGYISAMEKHHLLPITYEYDDLHEEIDGVLKKALSNSDPEVILCSNDIIAIRVLKKLKEWHIQVPKKVSVIGFDDIPQSEKEGLSTMHVRKYDMAYAAAKRLYELLVESNQRACRISLYTHFVKRSSSI